MRSFHVDSVRWPDEFRYALASISSNFPKHATLEGAEIVLSGLSAKQSLVMSLFPILSEVDEVLTNLNLAMGDLERLRDDPWAFSDSNPFDRYKFVMRLWLYEFARFEDLFGYYTLWLEKRRRITKDERKQLRAEFYTQNETLIRMRNVFAHDKAEWAGHVTMEMGLLAALDAAGMSVADKEGKRLSWLDQMAPLCSRVLPQLLEAGQGMRVMWSMLMAELAAGLVEDGLLEKATVPFAPAPAFLRPGRPDR